MFTHRRSISNPACLSCPDAIDLPSMNGQGNRVTQPDMGSAVQITSKGVVMMPALVEDFTMTQETSSVTELAKNNLGHSEIDAQIASSQAKNPTQLRNPGGSVELAQKEMPRYQPKAKYRKTHERVHALHVLSVSTSHNTSLISFSEIPGHQEGFAPITASPADVRGLRIVTGGWYTISEKGANGFLPDVSFRAIYDNVPSLSDDEEPPQQAKQTKSKKKTKKERTNRAKNLLKKK